MYRLMLALLLTLAATPVAAAPMPVLPAQYNGTCSVADGCLVATPTWSDENATVYYSVTPISSGFLYQYTFGDGDPTDADGFDFVKFISHVLTEISGSITDANLADLIQVLANTLDVDGVEEWGDEGNSSPGIPGLIHGLKWTDQGPFAFIAFTSPRNPIWGDFYSKDGTNQPTGDVYAYTAGFGTDPATSALGPTGWIPTPDTTTTPCPAPPCVPDPQLIVPFPGTLVLVLAGALIIASAAPEMAGGWLLLAGFLTGLRSRATTRFGSR